MIANTCTGGQTPDGGFDLFRLSKSKEAVDICSNTLRAYHREGLPFYYRGRAVFVSRSEVSQFIRAGAWRARGKAGRAVASADDQKL